LKSIPLFLRHASNKIISSLNKTPFRNNYLRKIEKAIYISSFGAEEMLEEIHALFDLREMKRICLESNSLENNYSSVLSDSSLIRKAMHYRVKYELPLDMLIKVDRMSMSNSLEVRAPFLDPDLFKASTVIPDRFLRNAGIGKLVLREIMKDTLPEEVFNHPKSGFSIPMHDFKNTVFRKLAIDLLNKDYMKKLFNPVALELILEVGLNESEDTFSGSIYRKTHQLWSLMMLSGWISYYKIEV
jgi:asparagine synthase (glutamine-hydrolysing)